MPNPKKRKLDGTNPAESSKKDLWFTKGCSANVEDVRKVMKKSVYTESERLIVFVTSLLR
jgi:hypothetical protein